MAEAVHGDVVEEILIRLDAKDLTRYKSVCKSWRSLIATPCFVKSHLNLTYNKDRYNNRLGHRRVSLYTTPCFFNHHLLVGSSGGLVCTSSFMSELIVGNPLTREVRQLAYPPCIGAPLYWGFGYDSLRDDYKVIVGARRGKNQTCFQVLSLKSNVWSDIGEKKYTLFSNAAGILCNGALHWSIINLDESMKASIISFDLSNEEFKEIPLPDDASYRFNYDGHLGIIKECLCIVGNSSDDSTYVINNYNVKESWERVKIPHDGEMKYDIVHLLRLDGDALWFYRALEHDLCWENMAAPIFVESLVSPHGHDKARGLPSSWNKGFSWMPLKPIPHAMEIKYDCEHVYAAVKESETVEEIKIEKSESDHRHAQDLVAKESEIDQTVSVLIEKVTTNLLTYMSSLSPFLNFGAFDKLNLLKLAEMYPCDFNFDEKDKLILNGVSELGNYVANVKEDTRFDNLNGMGDGFLNDACICYVEREFLQQVSIEDVMQHFQKMKARREQL
ncbi:F-box/kelch-repeat protein At3g06240-like [Bidens hawaiensis]|uniref:F-box/kelch-repeat protein At3g06240-like n=1 Tax=Bidens hawaiensis TaxID=980011 RepID=UPI00404B9D58